MSDLLLHVSRLAESLDEAIRHVELVDPGGWHNAGMWQAALDEARAALAAGLAPDLPRAERFRCRCGGGGVLLQVFDPGRAGPGGGPRRWLCAATGQDVIYCPRCGMALGPGMVREVA